MPREAGFHPAALVSVHQKDLMREAATREKTGALRLGSLLGGSTARSARDISPSPIDRCKTDRP